MGDKVLSDRIAPVIPEDQDAGPLKSSVAWDPHAEVLPCDPATENEVFTMSAPERGKIESEGSV